MTKKTLHILRLLFLVIGFFLLIGIIQKIGLTAIQNQIAKLSWKVAPILMIGFTWYIFYTLSWRTILKQQGPFISFWSLFRVKIIGETINTMTPANFLGGDPMRIYFLKGPSNVTDLAASVVVDRTINSIAIVAVIFIGAFTAFVAMPDLPKSVLIGIGCFLFLAQGGLIFFLLKQRKGLFQFLAFHLSKKHLPKAKELDKKLLSFYQKSHKAFWKAFAFHLFGRVLGIAEIYLIGKALEPRFNLFIALILATLAPVINMIFTFVPGAVGIMEGAYSTTLFLLGFSPALGLTIQMIKRIRSGLWIALGLIFILGFRDPRRGGLSPDPLHKPLQFFR